ncbi:tryptophan--tRNA ligase [Patescibacteria group bacterium]|nr:tryptophan--tRNA ligase [Patescibacteria group bacterium]MBU1123556.1 tryptophan--tRNA ligase [Patescibacteria group bacterium]MBU1911607.1 tryptophan--tRNA ligase [Patescibacteria group bacterium]
MRVLSGIQPSGQLHIGNYFGSIKPNLEFTEKSDQSLFFVADLHALTTIQDASVLNKAREDIVLDYLACGFDPEKAIIFDQSQIPEHTELMWILSCITPMGLLERAVSYKDKVQKGIIPSVGLFAYPVLMAADILLYDATHVPVGKDQKQHVEMARDIAQKFNTIFGKDALTIPEPVIREEVAVVPGVDGQKMSKSYGNTIPLFGDEKKIKKIIMGIVTDSAGQNDPKDPEKSTIYIINKLFLDKKVAEKLADEYKSGISYGDAKKRLFEDYMDYMKPMRETREKLTTKDVEEVLASGRERAGEIAGGTMERVRKAVGLG